MEQALDFQSDLIRTVVGYDLLNSYNMLDLAPCDDTMLEAKLEISFFEVFAMLKDKAIDIDIGVNFGKYYLSVLLDEVKFLDGANQEEYTAWLLEMM